MSGQPSTIRTSNQPTIGDPFETDGSPDVAESIVRYWREEAGASVVRTFEAYPSLASRRSLLIDLAVEEFKASCGNSGFDVQDYCKQFRRFGSHFEQSIHRAIEVQQYLDEHPELLGFVADFSWPSSGESLKGFEVLEELGRGALARVYLCREAGLAGREVVLKVARSDGYEAELLARLDHPNIVPIYSVASDAKQYVTCICMPFRGRSTLQDLADQITSQVPRNGDFVWEVARQSEMRNTGDASAETGGKRGDGSYVDAIVRILSVLADALAHAHRAGVLHGDLKPSNVLLTPDCEPLLIDFNLAKDHEKDAKPRGGTLAYMPPETLQSICSDGQENCGTYDVRSEVYSFGVLLFQLLTGDVPFPLQSDVSDAIAISSDLLRQHSCFEPNVRGSNPTINAGLEQLVLDCIATTPSKRPKSMDEVAERLRRQTRLIPRVRRWARLHPRKSLTLSVITACLLVVSAAYLVLRPPYHVRQFNRGIASQAKGDYAAAISYFRQAMDDDDLRPEAMYQRARSLLLNDEPSLAFHEFGRCESEFHDNRSTAEIGYCFNLRGDHDAAIVCYEEALSNGFESAELQNNLGISYAICQSHVGHLERFDRAADHLCRAIALKQDLLSARLNLLTVTLIRGDYISGADARRVARNAEWLLRHDEGDTRMLRRVSLAYGNLASFDPQYSDRCAQVCLLALKAKAGPTRMELSSHFKALHGHESFSKLLDLATDSQPKLGNSPGRFLDPVGAMQLAPLSLLQSKQ
jgi:serine/threonine protein kinase